MCAVLCVGKLRVCAVTEEFQKEGLVIRTILVTVSWMDLKGKALRRLLVIHSGGKRLMAAEMERKLIVQKPLERIYGVKADFTMSLSCCLVK